MIFQSFSGPVSRFGNLAGRFKKPSPLRRADAERNLLFYCADGTINH